MRHTRRHAVYPSPRRSAARWQIPSGPPRTRSVMVVPVRQSDRRFRRPPTNDKSRPGSDASVMVAQAALRTPITSSSVPLLSVSDVSVRFGGIVALDGVSFDVAQGQVAGLIGPNGAGKTTLFNCLSRLYVPDEGDIRFEGRSILRSPRHAIPKIGIGRTF